MATLIGSAAVGTNGSDFEIAGKPIGSKIAATASGTIDTITVRPATANTCTSLKVEIWSDSAGTPGTKIAGSTTGTITITAGSSAEFTSGSGINAAVVSGTTYWIVMLAPSGGNQFTYSTATGNNGAGGTAGGMKDTTATGLTAIPASWGTTQSTYAETINWRGDSAGVAVTAPITVLETPRSASRLRSPSRRAKRVISYLVSPVLYPAGTQDVSSTMTVSAVTGTSVTGQKATSASLTVNSRTGLAVTGARSVSSALSAAARTATAWSGAKDGRGTLGVTVRAATALAGRKGGVSTLAAGGRTSSSFAGQRTTQTVIAVTGHVATVVTGRKQASGTLTAVARASTAFSGRKSVSSAVTAAARASVQIVGSSLQAKTSTMTVAARAAVAMAARKGVLGTFAPASRATVVVTARKGITSTLTARAVAAALFVGRKSVTSTTRIDARAITLFIGGQPIVSSFTVSARARISINAFRTAATFGYVTGGDLAAVAHPGIVARPVDGATKSPQAPHTAAPRTGRLA